MRTMALDYGTRRIGVAVTDPTGVLAQPLETIHRKGRAADASWQRIAAIVDEYDVTQIVVGLPLHMDGRSGDQAERSRAFGDEVARRTGLPVHYLDERWTTREAERMVRESGSRRSRRALDPVAAAILLRTWLERETR